MKSQSRWTLIFINTQSKWSQKLLSFPPVHLGEKFSQTSLSQKTCVSPDLTVLGLSYTEAGINLLQCVDPHLVNPVISHKNLGRSAENIKLYKYSEAEIEMEKFSDLTLLLSNSTVKPNYNSTERTEVEIFDEYENDNFTSPEFQSPDFEDTEILQFSNQSIDNDVYNSNKFIINSDKLHHLSETTATQFFDSSSNILNYDYDSTGNSSNYSNSRSIRFEATNSDRSRVFTNARPKPSLQLNFEKKIMPDINTPDVIETVTSLENAFGDTGNTKVLPQVEKIDHNVYLEPSFLLPSTFENTFEEVFDIEVISADELSNEYIQDFSENNVIEANISCHEIDAPELKNVLNSASVKTRTPIKRTFIYPSTSDDSTIGDIFHKDFASNDEDSSEYIRDDDDEDYVPQKKLSRRKKSSYSDGSLPKRRGRPPRKSLCTQSVSRNVDKYRELRDKNNEASRKSRLKRRIKEQQQMDEAEELSERNIELKAQVAELEKAISSYRQNLFKMMMNK